MACTHWNDAWIADLYGELDAAERDRFRRHLAGCECCRRTVARLESSRSVLREHAPAVPPAPRLIALPSTRPRARPVLPFVAGLAAATLLFAAGLVAAPWVRPAAGAAGSAVTAADVEAAVADALAEQRRSFESELAGLRTASAEDAASPTPTRSSVTEQVTRQDLERAMAALERRIHLDRASDVEFLLGELQATEARAAAWFDDNREALMLVAMQNDPRFNER